MKVICLTLIGIVLFVCLNVIALIFFNDADTPDVDGKYCGFTKEELMKTDDLETKIR